MEEFIKELREKSATNKDARINFNKVVAYLDILEEMGTRVGEPVTKHLDGEIWELRPLSNRILYAYVKDNTFLLLHHFKKKTKRLHPEKSRKQKGNWTIIFGGINNEQLERCQKRTEYHC